MASPPASTIPLARTPEEWTAEMARLKERSFHGKQVFKWIHQRGVTDAAAMTDLPATLRAKLAEEGLKSVLDVVQERRATDDTRKLLVALGDGANVETVLIPRRPKADTEDADAAAVVEDED